MAVLSPAAAVDRRGPVRGRGATAVQVAAPPMQSAQQTWTALQQMALITSDCCTTRSLINSGACTGQAARAARV